MHVLLGRLYICTGIVPSYRTDAPYCSLTSNYHILRRPNLYLWSHSMIMTIFVNSQRCKQNRGKTNCFYYVRMVFRFNAHLDWRGFVVNSRVVELWLILVDDASFKYVSTDFLYFSLVTFIMYTIDVTGGCLIDWLIDRLFEYMLLFLYHHAC